MNIHLPPVRQCKCCGCSVVYADICDRCDSKRSVEAAIKSLMAASLEDDGLFGVPEPQWRMLGHGGDERCFRCNCIRTGVAAWNECPGPYVAGRPSTDDNPSIVLGSD